MRFLLALLVATAVFSSLSCAPSSEAVKAAKGAPTIADPLRGATIRPVVYLLPFQNCEAISLTEESIQVLVELGLRSTGVPLIPSGKAENSVGPLFRPAPNGNKNDNPYLDLVSKADTAQPGALPFAISVTSEGRYSSSDDKWVYTFQIEAEVVELLGQTKSKRVISKTIYTNLKAGSADKSNIDEQVKRAVTEIVEDFANEYLKAQSPS